MKIENKKNNIKKFNKNGFLIRKFKNKNIVDKIRRIIKKHFYKKDSYYCNISLERFHKIAYNCQVEINDSNIIRLFDQSEGKIVREIINNEEPLYESFLFLRAVRPARLSKYDESVSLHRESFYTKQNYIKYAINIWFPIINVDSKSSIKFIPKSHKIPDNLIKRTRIKLKNYPIKRFSDGHRIGFFYAPKKIISGVNLKNQKKMLIPPNSFALFSSMLIHGNGTNQNDKVRFAIGWGFLPKSKMKKIRKVDPRRFKGSTNYFKKAG